MNADIDDGTCEFEIDNGEDNQGNDGTTGDTCVGICDEDLSDPANSDESDPVFALTIVMIIIFAAAISVIIVSKDKDSVEDLAQEDLDEEFIPELPPLEPPKN